MRPFLIALAVVLGLVAVLVAALPWLAEPALHAGLRLAAPDVTFERLRFDWGDLELEGVALGQGDQEARRVRVAWRLPDLLEGRLERVEVEGLVVRGAWRDGRLHLAGIEPDEADEADAALPIPEIGEAALREARLELQTPFGTLAMPFSAKLRTLGERLAFEATIDDARIAGIAATGDIAAARIEVAAEGSAQAARGTFAIAVADAGLAAGDLVVDGAALDQHLAWSYAADTLTLHAGAPGALAIEGIAAADLRAGPVRARLEPGDRPLLELALGEGPTWRVHAIAAIEALEVPLAAPAPLRLQSQGGRVTLAAEGTESLESATIALADGQLRLPEQDLVLDGIAAQAMLRATGLAPGQSVPIRVERISHGGKPAWFAPLAFEAELLPDAEEIAFDGTVTRIGGGLTLEVRGSSTPAGDGQATVALAPVAFGPGLQPQDLAPIATGLVRDVSGRVALDGDLTWSAAGLEGGLAILVDQLGLSAGPARLEQVNGVVRLDRLWPPGTPPDQQLAIGLLELGLPLTAGITTFQLTAGPRLEVEQLQWRLAGGVARAEPFSIGSPGEGLNVTLRAEGLDLGQLLALTRLDGLSGEGSLDGVLPLRISEGVAMVAGGKLAATGPGVLRYAAGAAPPALQAGGEGVDLLLQALENFHYEALEITLDGRTDAAMDIALHLAGANPDLYDGYPVEFNLDLEGELANILRQGMASYQIPERIRERMQGFGR
jgi:Dicarboxylate transport